MEELNDTRAKWYDIGLQLGVSVGTLNAIKKDYNSTSDCLRETLTKWLKTCPSVPTWNSIVDALRSSTVGEVRLAADLEQKHCSTQDTSVAATIMHSQHPDHKLTPSPLVSTSQAHTWTTLPPQSTIPPTQSPVLAYSGTPASHLLPWSAPYYYSPHTGYPLYTPFPLTPPTSGVATASSCSPLPQVTPTSSRPFLPSVPAQPTTLPQYPSPPSLAQPTTPQFPTTLPQYPSPSSLTTIPPDTSSIPPSATVTTPPDLPPPVTAHTLGRKVLSHLHEIV